MLLVISSMACLSSEVSGSISAPSSLSQIVPEMIGVVDASVAAETIVVLVVSPRRSSPSVRLSALTQYLELAF